MQQNRRVWLWFAPVLLLLGAVYIVPVLDVLRLSFSNATLLRPVTSYGLQSYRDMLGGDSLGGILQTTAIFTLLNVLGLQLAGLCIALLLIHGDNRRLRGMSIPRIIVLAALVIPGVANGLIWQMLSPRHPSARSIPPFGSSGSPRSHGSPTRQTR